MRTIKFRGKQITTGNWLYGDLMHDSENGCYIYPMDAEGLYKENKVIPETVGQFTGQCDMNGKEIYEGDILKDAWDCMNVVVWDEETAGLYLNCDGCFSTFMDAEMEEDRIKVIGNIHENPELIKE